MPERCVMRAEAAKLSALQISVRRFLSLQIGGWCPLDDEHHGAGGECRGNPSRSISELICAVENEPALGRSGAAHKMQYQGHRSQHQQNVNQSTSDVKHPDA